MRRRVASLRAIAVLCAVACVLSIGTAPAPAATNDGLPVTLRTLAGETITARLLSIGEDGAIVVRASAAEKHISLYDLDSVRPDKEANTKRPSNDVPADDNTAVRRLSCTFHLVGDDLLTGVVLERPTDPASRRAVRVDIGLRRPLNIPLSNVSAVRFAQPHDADAQREFDARREQRDKTRDLLIVTRGGKASVLPGALERVSPSGWEFEFGSRKRTGSFDQAYGVVLGGDLAEPMHADAIVRFADGGSLHVRVLKADAATLFVDAGALGRIDIPWRRVRSLDVHSGRRVYLSDIEPTGVVHRSILGAEWPPQRDKSVTGGPMTLTGKTYNKGLGVHAYTALTFALDGQFEQLLAEVGIDASMNGRGNAVVRVLGDDRVLFEHREVLGGALPLAITVDLTGIKTLVLECAEGAGLDLSDHVNWADARIIRAKPEATR